MMSDRCHRVSAVEAVRHAGRVAAADALCSPPDVHDTAHQWQLIIRAVLAVGACAHQSSCVSNPPSQCQLLNPGGIALLWGTIALALRAESGFKVVF